jgi:hypothetical protein
MLCFILTSSVFPCPHSIDVSLQQLEEEECTMSFQMVGVHPNWAVMNRGPQNPGGYMSASPMAAVAHVDIKRRMYLIIQPVCDASGCWKQ